MPLKEIIRTKNRYALRQVASMHRTHRSLMAQAAREALSERELEDLEEMLYDLDTD